MSRLGDAIVEARMAGRLAFIPFVIPGFPDLRTSIRALDFLRDVSVTAFETATPTEHGWSEETNPTIRDALRIAAAQGISMAVVVERIRAYRPNILVTYQPVISSDVVSFIRAISNRVDGVLLEWDATTEEEVKFADDHGVDVIQAISLEMSPQEVERRARLSRGFVYLTVAKTTGGTIFQVDAIEKAMAQVRECTPVPICCAFGVDTPAKIRMLAGTGMCDGVIVGTALLRELAVGFDRFADLARRLVAAAKSTGN